MSSFALPLNARPLDIRAAFALAKVYQRFDLGPHATMMAEALLAAERYPCGFLTDEKDFVDCPLLFVDEPQLVTAWNKGVAAQRAWLAEIVEEMELEEAETAAKRDRLDALKTKPMPTGADLLAKLLGGEHVEVEGHRLELDEHGIWVTNPYGLDSGIFAPTVRACDRFIRYMRQGGEYGPTPD